MRGSHYFGGGVAERVKYQIGEAMANAGVPVLSPTLINTDGLRLPSTTDATEAIGLTMDAQATRNTAQQTGNVDPAARVTVDINPNLIIHARLCGGATSGTNLTAVANTTADATGLLLTFAASQAAYDDGYCWGADGANPGIFRKLTAVTTTAVPIIAFPFDIAANDNFYLCTVGPGELAEAQLTSDFTEVDATGDNQGGANTLRCVAFDEPGPNRMRSTAEDGASKSFAYFRFSEHHFGGAGI